MTPLTIDRVAEIFTNEDLQYRIGDEPNILLSGFPNTAVALIIDGNTLKFEGRWRGEPPSTDAPTILAVVNEWNLTQIMPALHFVETTPGTLALIVHRELLTEGGVSHNQLGAFITSSIHNTLACFNWLEEQFPTLVTWETPATEATETEGAADDE